MQRDRLTVEVMHSPWFPVVLDLRPGVKCG